MRGFKKRKTYCWILAVIFIFAALSGGRSGISNVRAEDEIKKSGSEDDKVLIQPTSEDIDVIPDIYNTGVSGNLNKYIGVEAEDADISDITPLNGNDGTNDCKLYFKKSGGRYVVDFGAKVNSNLPDRLVISDYDFSDIIFATSRQNFVTSKKTIVFKNCIFDYFTDDYFDGNLSFEFFNCKIRRFEGSNASFDKCFFGGSFLDPLIPFRNVEVKNSYFTDLNYPSSNQGNHIDGTQIFGYRYIPKGFSEYSQLDAINIKYYNCRFEVPNIAFENNKATVNACVMIQLEYSDAENITVENCILNGGVYSIFTQTDPKRFTLKDITLKDIRIGAAKTFGSTYPVVDKNVDYSNIRGTETLYVSSVYKNNGKTYFVVSNDTCRERKLRIVTSSGNYDFTVKAGGNGRENPDGFNCLLSDFPLDIVEEINEDCSYAVCLDLTDENNVKQIRFVNYTDNLVYIDKSLLGSGYNKDVVLKNEAFGNGFNYTLTRTASNEYILEITGNGTMPGYTKVVTPPWFEYMDYINKVIIGEGIENVGQFSFHGCVSLEEVKLPSTIKSIEKFSFSQCPGIKNINVPESVTIGEAAFSGVQHVNEKGVPIPLESGENSSGENGNGDNGENTPQESYNNPSNEGKETVIPKDKTDQDNQSDSTNVKTDNSGNSQSDNSNGKSNNKESSYSNEWIDGRWYDADGRQTYPGIMQWKSNSKGWWIEDSTGWYPVSSWQKINGYWYYFDASGYMASMEWIGGYWIGSDGTWTYPETGIWKSDSQGWWFEDTSGWYPVSKWQKIDGYWYYFDGTGYIVTSQYIDGFWLDVSGQYSNN